MILAVVMILAGYALRPDSTGSPSDIGLAVYKTFQSFVLESDAEDLSSSWLILTGAFLAPISLAGAIVVGLFETVREAFTVGFITLFVRKQVLVAGPAPLVERLLARRNEDAEDYRIVCLIGEEGSISVVPGKGRRVLQLKSVLTSRRSWLRGGVRRSRAIILLVDGVAGLADTRLALESAWRRTPELFLGFDNPEELDSLGELWGLQSRSPKSEPVRAFSMRRLAAASLVESQAPHLSVGMKMLSEEPVHICLDGFSVFAGNIILEAAQLYVYPCREKLRVSVITENRASFDRFFSDNPGLNRVVDFKIFTRNEFSPVLRMERSCPLPSHPHAVYGFPESDWKIPGMARNWRRFLADCYGDTAMITPLSFLMPEEGEHQELTMALQEHLSHLRITVVDPDAFIGPARILGEEPLVDSMARNIHDRYRAQYSMPLWEDLSYRQMEANRRSARHYVIKLAFLGYRISDTEGAESICPDSIASPDSDQIKALAMMEHRRWMVEKYLDDFIPPGSGGTVMDPSFLKTKLRVHKDLREFEELTEEDIAKDIATFRDWASVMADVLGVRNLVRIEAAADS